MDRLVRLRIDHLHHCFDQWTRCEVLSRAGLHILGVPGEQAFIDVALHIDRQAKPGFAVDQTDETFEFGGALNLVLRFQKDRADDSALF